MEAAELATLMEKYSVKNAGEGGAFVIFDRDFSRTRISQEPVGARLSILS